MSRQSKETYRPYLADNGLEIPEMSPGTLISAIQDGDRVAFAIRSSRTQMLRREVMANGRVRLVPTERHVSILSPLKVTQYGARADLGTLVVIPYEVFRHGGQIGNLTFEGIDHLISPIIRRSKPPLKVEQPTSRLADQTEESEHPNYEPPNNFGLTLLVKTA